MTICHVSKNPGANNVIQSRTFPVINACGVYYFVTFVALQHTGLSLILVMGGKSGQRRAPYFLTGSCSRGQSNVTENNRRIRSVRVKRRGKSSPGLVGIQGAVRLMGCKVMYTGYDRMARPMPGGRLLELAGNGKSR